jgi:hypothetical protein
MYVRQAKQYLRNAIEGFDETKYGFASVVDLLRAAGREGVLRIERDRQGAVRVFGGPKLEERPAAAVTADIEADLEGVVTEPVADAPIVDAEAVEPASAEAVVVEEAPKRKTRPRRAAAARAPREAKAKTARPRSRKGTRPRAEPAASE